MKIGRLLFNIRDVPELRRTLEESDCEMIWKAGLTNCTPQGIATWMSIHVGAGPPKPTPQFVRLLIATKYSITHRKPYPD